MYDLPDNSLYQYLQNPVFLRSNFGSLPARKLYEKMEKYSKDNKKMASPDDEAILFYLINHTIHLFKNKYGEHGLLTDDEAKFVDNAVNRMNDICERLFFYIVKISIEEAMSLHDDRDSFWGFIEGSYGKDFTDYAKKGMSFDFKNVSTTVDNFLNGIKGLFLWGKWSPAFGGKPWAEITVSAKEVVCGKSSLELMADYGFSLCHNNGSMFNKGHYYTMYSHEIYDILDVQASGQIPQWLAQRKSKNSKEIQDFYENLIKFFPEEKEKKFDKKMLDDGAKKRREEAKKKLGAVAAQAGNLNFGGAGQNGTNGKKHVEQKIDTLIIDAFNGMKKNY